MKKSLLRSFKHFLTIVGSRSPNRYLHQLQMVVNYMKLGRWMFGHDFHFNHRVRDRDSVFAAVTKLVRDQRVLYLEFGVYKGATFLQMVDLASQQNKRCHGVDSFQGMGEPTERDRPSPDVEHSYPAGKFKTEHYPDALLRKLINTYGTDSLAWSLWIGWVPDVLKQIETQAWQLSFAHIDMDHYEPTAAALKWAWNRLVPGGMLLCHDYIPGCTWLATPAIDRFLQRHKGATETTRLPDGYLAIRKKRIVDE